MIAWGEIINQVRSLHLKFYESFPYEYKDIQLKTKFEFPSSTGDYSDWEPLNAPEVIELNPVERVLLEGPLFPTEKISLSNEIEVSLVIKQILMLEREWLAQMNLVKPEHQIFIEQSLLRLQNSLSGKPRLRAV